MASSHCTDHSPDARSSAALVNGLGLRGRIILILLVVSILPLAVVGIGSGVVFGTLLENKALELQRSTVRTHATTLDLYLAERVRALDLAARTHRPEQLADDANLRRLFDRLQEIHGRSLVDLGVIDASGKHLAYVGPYDLGSKNYADTPWFRHVMAHGSYVSDVFLGYRNVPHCVIAIRRDDDRGPWILRATINSQRLDELVGAGSNMNGFAAFVVNTEGAYQTSPPVGAILEASGIRDARPHVGVRDERLQVDGRDVIQVTAWVNDGRWMLVVRQSADSVRAPVREAMQRGALVTAVAVMLLVITTVLATRHLTGKIDRANAQREQLSRELLRSSKLASVGELATGLAHEINNPLAVISAERTNLLDCISMMKVSEEEGRELGESMDRIGRQVARCAGITARMLKFGRNRESKPSPTTLAAPIREVARMMDKQARVRNVKIVTQVEEGLAGVVVDATELEQVLVNLVNNAFHAMPDGGTLSIEARSEGEVVLLDVCDSGRGISAENLERVFEPFFTTKPVGEGTGLGLSVCYGIVRGWGGEVRINSEVNVGTTVTLILPVVTSPEDERQIAR